MDANQLQELAVKAPSTIPETEAEADLRERSREQYFRVNYDADSPGASYNAGWKAAKAYYEAAKQ